VNIAALRVPRLRLQHVSSLQRRPQQCNGRRWLRPLTADKVIVGRARFRVLAP
jgi:hypothetical protein